MHEQDRDRIRAQKFRFGRTEKRIWEKYGVPLLEAHWDTETREDLVFDGGGASGGDTAVAGPRRLNGPSMEVLGSRTFLHARCYLIARLASRHAREIRRPGVRSHDRWSRGWTEKDLSADHWHLRPAGMHLAHQP
jgi:hypothetical protein